MNEKALEKFVCEKVTILSGPQFFETDWLHTMQMMEQ